MKLTKTIKKVFSANTFLYNVRFYQILKFIWVFENFLRSPLVIDRYNIHRKKEV